MLINGKALRPGGSGLEGLSFIYYRMYYGPLLLLLFDKPVLHRRQIVKRPAKYHGP